MSVIKPIFATPLFMDFWYDREHLGELKKYIEEEVEFDDGFVSQSKSTNILAEEKFSRLREFFHNCVLGYLREIHRTEDNLKITQSWVNRAKKGDTHRIHHHPNSVISGVFYVYSEENSPHIQFYRPDVLPYQFNHNGVNEYTSDSYHQPPQMGVLLLFPSYLTHFVEQNKEETDRLSISFNTTFDGVCGNDRALTLSGLTPVSI